MDTISKYFSIFDENCFFIGDKDEKTRKIPKNIKKIVVKSYDNIGDSLSSLPENIESLILACDYKFSSDNDLSHLKNLVVQKYSRSLGNLPSNLEKLTIIEVSNPFDNLPSKIKELELYGNIETLKNLPPQLESLIIHGQIMEEVNELPNTLQKISLLGSFNQVISIPSSCKEIILGEDFDKDISVSDCEYLEIRNKSYNKYLSVPSNLKSLKLWYVPSRGEIENLPDTLEKLIFMRGGEECEELIFPESITHLQLPPAYNHEINNLPKLEWLSIGYQFSQDIILPETLKDLFFSAYQKMENSDEMISEGIYPKLLNIPRESSVLQIPIENNFEDGELKPDLSLFENFEEDGEINVPHLPNLTEVKFLDEFSVMKPKLSIFDDSDETDSSIDEESLNDEIKQIFQHNPQVKYTEYECQYDFLTDHV